MADNIMDKLCEGCLTHERSNERVLSSSLTYGECPGYVNKDTNCPCQYCLIKMICDSPCGLFKKRFWVNMDKGVLHE